MHLLDERRSFGLEIGLMYVPVTSAVQNVGTSTSKKAMKYTSKKKKSGTPGQISTVGRGN